jgi:hypothetical protein
LKPTATPGGAATGTAAPHVIGAGFDPDVQYVCLWRSGNSKSAANAKFVDGGLLHCGRPDATFATLFTDDPDLQVTMEILDGDGEAVLNGKHDEHTFGYSSGSWLGFSGSSVTA